MAACSILDRFGWLEDTGFYNVVVLRVDDIQKFLEDFLERWSSDAFVPGCFSRVVPVSVTFSYSSADELECASREAMRPWISTVAGHSYHVRMHRRGFKDRVVSHTEEQSLGAFVDRELTARGESARIDFDDPDFVVVVETVGQRAGMALWTRADRERYPFLNLD